MKTHKLAGSICALLLTVLGASSAVAQTSTASILFMREFDQPGNSNAYGIRLGRVQPSGEGVAWLTPLIYGVSFHGDGWSPQGAAVVYERSPLGRGTSQLYVVNRQGGNVRQITTGPTDNTRASWGPNGIIAFVNRDNEIDDTTSRDCLATVRPDGTQQHIVFCPPRPPGAENSTYVVMSEPQWSADGKCVYVVTGTDDGNAQPRKWFSDAYRVNVATGTAVRLTRQVFTEAINVRRPLAIAPDGMHGVYGGDPMQAIDFATDTLRPLSTRGDLPVYSQDGRKIAFARQNSKGFRRTYVMKADGSDVRPALANPAPATEYVPSDWSFDGTRVLVDAFGGIESAMIIDLRTKTATPLIQGYVDVGAWFHR